MDTVRNKCPLNCIWCLERRIPSPKKEAPQKHSGKRKTCQRLHSSTNSPLEQLACRIEIAGIIPRALDKIKSLRRHKEDQSQGV